MAFLIIISYILTIINIPQFYNDQKLTDDDYFDTKPLPDLPHIPDTKNRIKTMKNYIIRILPNPGPRIASSNSSSNPSSSSHKARPQISSPINFDHVLHVGFNPETGEFEGLPPEWERLLSNSGITSTERKENPDTIIAVSFCLKFLLTIESCRKFTVSSKKLITLWKVSNFSKQLFLYLDWLKQTFLVAQIPRWAQVKQGRGQNHFNLATANGSTAGASTWTEAIATNRFRFVVSWKRQVYLIIVSLQTQMTSPFCPMRLWRPTPPRTRTMNRHHHHQSAARTQWAFTRRPWTVCSYCYKVYFWTDFKITL